MFLNDAYIDQSQSECSIDSLALSPLSPGASRESDSYKDLLNAVDAARDGLAWGEHDYDVPEEDVV